jgi:hypothetical protein
VFLSANLDTVIVVIAISRQLQPEHQCYQSVPCWSCLRNCAFLIARGGRAVRDEVPGCYAIGGRRESRHETGVYLSTMPRSITGIDCGLIQMFELAICDWVLLYARAALFTDTTEPHKLL